MREGTPGRPEVSVIVPVFNDGVGLSRCLEALDHQEGCSYEVVVIDNGSAPEQDIAGVVSHHPRASYVYEPRPGSYAARNAGLRHARADVIGFTDADCVPATDWVQRGRRHLLGCDLGMVVGRIDVDVSNRPSSVELYDRVIAFPQEQHLRDLHFGATANVFTTRATIDAVGGFDPALKSGGDVEWGQRVAAAGIRQWYADDVVVRHPARRTFAQIFRRMQRVAGGVYERSCVRGTFLARQWAFVRVITPDLLPPVRFALSLRRHPDLRGVWPRARVIAVMMLARYVSAWEKVRLKLGAVAVRE